jgi:hypothetical protein
MKKLTREERLAGVEDDLMAAFRERFPGVHSEEDLNNLSPEWQASEPCAYPASNESLDMSGRNALAPLRCLIVSSQ